MYPYTYMFIYAYKHYLYAIADARKDWIERCLAITIDDLPTTSKIAVDSSASARLSSPRRDAYTVLCALCLLVQTSADVCARVLLITFYISLGRNIFYSSKNKCPDVGSDRKGVFWRSCISDTKHSFAQVLNISTRTCP